jgi:UDP-4-amino-4,6-dideoxy-N-acetyl-beta-L-altrosamine N-acetyltransferase
MIALRRINADDHERLLEWRNSNAVAKFMYSDHKIERDEHARWFQGVLNDKTNGHYWIIESGLAPVGLVNISDINLEHSRCTWAYYLAEPTARGKGLGSAIEFAMLEYVFETLNLNKIWCEVLASNEPVIRLHERFGFQKEAKLRNHIRKKNAFVDVIGLGLLKTEWVRIREQLRTDLTSRNVQPPSVPTT